MMTFDPEAVRAFERSGWDRAAPTYEASFAAATRQFIPALLEAADVRAGQRVLDMATGPGCVAAGAAARGAIVTGLDFSPAMLAVARAGHPSIAFDEGDAETLPYPSAGFDVVVSNFGIHHVPRPPLALGEAYRVLRPGGRMAFTIWAEPTDNIAWKLLFDAVARCGDPAASRAPPPGGGFGSATHCLAALHDAGFDDTATRQVRSTWWHGNGRALIEAMRAGTARMAAMIEAQPPDALPAIAAEIDAAASPWRQAGGIAVPIAAVVASGVKR